MEAALRDDCRALDVHEAFVAGDLRRLGEALGDPSRIPGGPLPAGMGSCLEYAIYHSPTAFVATLLERGADADPEDPDGFPPLLAALGRERGGAAVADAVLELLDLLLDAGADPHRRGVNDWTALHMAVARRNRAAVERLLERGADPRLRSRIDDRETPAELARLLGEEELATLLEAAEEGMGQGHGSG